jgi:hypothetical protein
MNTVDLTPDQHKIVELESKIISLGVGIKWWVSPRVITPQDWKNLWLTGKQKSHQTDNLNTN